MEKGNILTNARSFARQMCSASHPLQSLETNSYHLPPPDNKPQQVVRPRGDGSSLTHIWQETLLSKGKTGVRSDLTINFCRAGLGTCTNGSVSHQPGYTRGGTCLSLEADTSDTLKCQKGPCNGPLQRSLITVQRQQGDAHVNTH